MFLVKMQRVAPMTISYAKVCRERGEPIEDIAGRLGLVGATLARWLRRDRREISAGFRSVVVVAAATDSKKVPGT